MKRSYRKASIIPTSRWLAYAAAGFATGPCLAYSVEAAIHYSGPVDLILDGSSFHTLPLNSGAFIAVYRSGTFGGDFEGMSVRAKSSGQVLNANVPYTWVVRKFRRGVNASTGPGTFSGFGFINNPGDSGSFRTLGAGYVVFRFNNGKGRQYGWMRIRTLQTGYDNQVKITDYAWADPGEPIQTGQKKESAALDAKMVPDSGSLGMLALGATGLLSWRHRRGQSPEES